MIVAVFAMLAMASPAGYLSGSVYLDQNEIKDQEWVAVASAFILPLAAVLALVVLLKAKK